MSAVPASQTIRTRGWIAAAKALLGAVAFLYFPILRYCVQQWSDNPDYSYGFLVPLFSGYLAWRFRDHAPKSLAWPEPWGLAFIFGGAALFVVAGFTNWAQEWLKGLSLVSILSGGVLLLGGWKSLKWLWPSLAFLLFMFPLPYAVEHWLGWYLQKIATVASTFVLQTLGYPAYSEGNIIHLYHHHLEVAKACSGLSMLLTFVALAVAMAILIDRPWADRVVVLVSAIPIAVISNVVRIVGTGILYDLGGEELGKRIFHDFAGWLMMPFALGLMWAELKLLDWLLVADLARASREEIIKDKTENPAFLFMLNNPALAPGGNKPAPGKKG